MQATRGRPPAAAHSREARAEVVRALGHPTRILLVEHLAQGERCVCELQEHAGGDLSTVSRHLAQLRGAGILISERRAQKVFYRLRTPCVLGFLECIDELLDESAGASHAGDR